MKESFYTLKFAPIREGAPTPVGLMRQYLSEDAAGGEGEAGGSMDATTSWKLVDSGVLQAVVANGDLQGCPLCELVERYPREVVGRRHVPGRPFPLCIRLVDVMERQPLFVHPERSGEWARQTSGPNVKFWYSAKSASYGEVIVGIRQGVTRLQVVDRLRESGLEEMLQVFQPRPGDAFFIPNCRLHSIGPGNLMWEIKERACDPLVVSHWGSEGGVVGDDDALLSCINFQDRQLGRISRDAGRTTHTRKIPLLHYCPRFTVDEIRLTDHLFDRTNGTTCHVLVAVRGTVEVHTEAGVESLPQGTVACIPAALGDYRIYVRDGTAHLLRVMLQSLV